MVGRKSRNNKNVNRLLRQVSESEFEYREYGVKKIRTKAKELQLEDVRWYDLPLRSYYKAKNWKRYRKSQWK